MLRKTLALAAVLAAVAGTLLAVLASRHHDRARPQASLPVVAATLPPDRAPDARLLGRARLAYASLQQHFATSAGYSEVFPGGGPSSAWPLSQALAATLSLAEIDPGYRPAVRSELRVLQRYWSPGGYMPYPGPPYGAGGPQYLDDNEWIGQDLVRAADLLGDRASLRRAEQVFSIVAAAWDTDESHACPGGVFWTHDPSNTDRNTVSTANGALLALELYDRTHKAAYLQWARVMYRWVDRCLAAPDGLYRDHLTPDGTVEAREWSYNQGAMIAAAVGLYRDTADRRYLDAASRTARAALADYGPANFASEPSFFVAIFFRDLKALDQLVPDPAFADAARRYADARWLTARAADTGLFPGEDGKATLLDQAAVVDLYAQLAS